MQAVAEDGPGDDPEQPGGGGPKLPAMAPPSVPFVWGFPVDIEIAAGTQLFSSLRYADRNMKLCEGVQPGPSGVAPFESYLRGLALRYWQLKATNPYWPERYNIDWMLVDTPALDHPGVDYWLTRGFYPLPRTIVPDREGTNPMLLEWLANGTAPGPHYVILIYARWSYFTRWPGQPPTGPFGGPHSTYPNPILSALPEPWRP